MSPSQKCNDVDFNPKVIISHEAMHTEATRIMSDYNKHNKALTDVSDNFHKYYSESTTSLMQELKKYFSPQSKSWQYKEISEEKSKGSGMEVVGGGFIETKLWGDQEGDKYKRKLEEIKTSIDTSIDKNNDIIKNLKDNVKCNEKEYTKYIKAVENILTSADASSPRKTVKKQLLKNKFLLAFVYITAILGGSYYVYKYFKK